MSGNLTVEVTGDGSTTLRNAELEETYHSLHGAYTESMHVFIRAGLNQWNELHQGILQVRIFEMGFGTGLNAALAWSWADQKRIPVEYHSIELYPLSEGITRELSFPGVSTDQLTLLHEAKWEERLSLSGNFTLKKEFADIRKFELVANSIDVIFYDAFAPSRQPDLWSISVMRKMADALVQGGVLVSYCAQGQFKRNLREAGLMVESLQGPPGKREMVRAMKPG